MGSSKDALCIIAGNMHEAEWYVQSFGLKPHDCVLVSSPEKLRGLPFGHKYVKVGTWYLRKDCQDVDMILQASHAVNIDGS